MLSTTEKGPAPGFKSTLVVAIFYAAVTVLFTWPIARDLSTRIPENAIDPIHLSYVLSSQARALVSDPGDFLDATYFHPLEDDLVYSEQHVGAVLLVLPAWLITENPLVLYNLVTLLTFFICAVTAYLLFREITGKAGPALVGGFIFAFVPYRLGNFAHIHVLLGMWIPLVLLFMWRFSRTRKWSDAVLTSFFFFLQVMTGIHIGVMAVLVISIAGVFILFSGGLLRSIALWTKLIPSVAVVLALTLFLLLPYLRLFRDQPQHRRSVDEIQSYSGGFSGLITAPGNNRLWGPVLERGRLRQFGWEKALFQGVTPVLLAGIGFVVAMARRERREGERFDPWPWIFGVNIILGFALALGPRLRLFGIGGEDGFLGLHGLLLETVPGFDSIRVPGRFILLSVFGMAGLSAYAVRGLTEKLKSVRSGPAVAVTTLIVLLTVEFVPTPVLTVPPPAIPPVYRWLATQPSAPLVSLPTGFIDGDVVAEWSYLPESRYLYFSSVHWRPMINGFSSNLPKKYEENIRALAAFPSQPAVDYLKDLGVQYVIVHTSRLKDTPWRSLPDQIPEILGSAVVYEQGGDFVLDVRKISSTAAAR